MTRIAPNWMRAPETVAVMAALRPADPHFVGGCVRDALMGRSGGDIDIAVAVTPDDVISLCTAAGLGAHPTGLDHGVITVTVSGHSFEIASLRRDVATDGRRAVIAFTTDMAEDAARRDFTMNALYADADGHVVDPLSKGLDDLRAQRIRFIGDAAARIREDYLRILRFFRFHAAFGITDFDPIGLAACHADQHGLSHISRERIGSEIMRLLGAKDPEPALRAMGPVLPLVLPGAVVPKGMADVEAAMGVCPNAIRMLVALGISAKGAAHRLRLSRKQVQYLDALCVAMSEGEPPALIAWRHGGEIAEDCIVLRSFAGTPPTADWRMQIERGLAAVLPVGASDLLAAGIAPGPAFGQLLRKIETDWLASDFALDRDTLLARWVNDRPAADWS